jgi:hypothetical protein
VRGGSWLASTRWRSCSWEMLERIQFDITAAKSRVSWKRKQQRCCGCERTRSTKGERERKKKRMEGKAPNEHSTHGFKGGRLDSSPSATGPPCQRDFRPRARPGETTAHNCDASVPAGCGLAEPARSHDGAVTSVMSAEMPAPITAPTSPLRPYLP